MFTQQNVTKDRHARYPIQCEHECTEPLAGVISASCKITTLHESFLLKHIPTLVKLQVLYETFWWEFTPPKTKQWLLIDQSCAGQKDIFTSHIILYKMETSEDPLLYHGKKANKHIKFLEIDSFLLYTLRFVVKCKVRLLLLVKSFS